MKWKGWFRRLDYTFWVSNCMVCCRDEIHQKKLMSRPVFNALRSQSRFLWGLNPSLPQVLYRFLFPTITNLNHLPSGNIAIQQKNGATTPKNTPLTIKMELEKCWFPKGSISFSMFRFYLNLRVCVTTCLFKKTTFNVGTSKPNHQLRFTSSCFGKDGFEKPSETHKKKNIPMFFKVVVLFLAKDSHKYMTNLSQ